MAKKKIGEVVTYNHVPSRIRSGNNRTWFKMKVDKAEAMFIGYRYIKEGYVDTDDDPDYPRDYFIPTNNIKVWLVVKNDRENPFYVYPLEEL